MILLMKSFEISNAPKLVISQLPESFLFINFALPQNNNKILDDFTNEKFIKRNYSGSYDITNLGALLISKDLKNFESFGTKCIRVIFCLKLRT